MSMRRLGRVLLVLGLAAILASNIHALVNREEPLVPDREVLESVSPDSRALERTEGGYGTYYRERPASGTPPPRSIAFVTDQVDPEIKGYAGEITLVAGVDSSGRLSGVRLMDHSETPSYMRDVVSSGFLEKLAGRKLGADLAGVDAVTGATITCEAIREDIQQGGALLAAEVFDMKVEGVTPPPGFIQSLAGPRSIAMIVAMGLAVAAFSYRRFRAGRAISLAAGFLVLGIYSNLPLSTAHFTNMALMKFPSPSNAPLILLLGFVFLTGLLFRSRVYCDYLCPFAAVQEAAHAVSGRKGSISEKVWRAGTSLRYGLLFAIVLLAAIGGFHAAGAMEPYVFLFNPGSAVLPWIYVAAAVTAAFFVRRFWCRVFCPCGVCVELVASLRGAGAGNRRPGRIAGGPQEEQEK